MFARIGVMRALNRNVVREFNPARKDKHRGRQKLARDSLTGHSALTAFERSSYVWRFQN